MCPLPTAITSRVPARERGVNPSCTKGDAQSGEHRQWPGQGCQGPRATFHQSAKQISDIWTRCVIFWEKPGRGLEGPTRL